MKVVQDKANKMSSQIKDFRTAFKNLFDDGLPCFGMTKDGCFPRNNITAYWYKIAWIIPNLKI